MTSIKEESKADQTAALAEAIRGWQTMVSKKASDNVIEAGLIRETLALLKGKKIDPYLEDVGVGQGVAANYQPDLDRPGTDLWNACREASAQCAGPGSRRKSISEVQGIAASMINRGTSNTATGHVRVLKVVLSAVRFLLENVQLKLALGNLTVAARRLEALRLVSSSVDGVLFQSLTAEYYMLRAKLACMECRPDLAEFHFSQTPPVKSIKNAGMVIKTCFEIGCDPLLTRGNRLKIRWLQRAVDLFDECSQDKEREEQIPVHVGLTLRHTLVQTHLSVNTEKAYEKLQQHLKVLKMVSSMDHETDHNVLFLILDVIRCVPNPDSHEYFRVLYEIVTTMPLTRDAVNQITPYFDFSKPDNGSLMISTFKEFLLLLTEQQPDMIQHAFLCFIHVAVDSELPEEDKILGISEGVKALHEKGVKPLSQADAHVVYALAGRQIETQWRDGHYPQAQQWCQFLVDASLTLLLESSKDNQVKAKKKYVSCALRCKDFEAARKMVVEIPRYLDENTHEFDTNAMFLEYLVKINVCEVDDESPCACQTHLALYPTVSSNDLSKVDYLKGCVLAAQEVGRFSEVMKAIHKLGSFVHRLVIENDDLSPALRDAEKDVSLLTLHVLSVEVDKDNLEQTVPDTMTHYLGIAANQMHEGIDPADQYYTASETRWICEMCFDLTWKLLKHCKVALVGRLTDTYSTLSRVYGNAPIWLATVPTGTLTRTELDECRIYLLEIARHAMLAQGDGENDSLEPAWHYGQVKTLINSMQSSLGIQRTVALYSGENHAENGMWVLYMEACLFLRDWPEAARGLCYTGYLQSEKTSRQVVNTILRLFIPRKIKVYMLRRVLCGFWEHRRSPRWATRMIPPLLHIIFELCIDGSPIQRVPSLREDFRLESRPHNLEVRASLEEGTLTYLQIAELVLDQALRSIEDSRYTRGAAYLEMHRDALENRGPSVCNNSAFPSSEIAYLAKAAFNQAAIQLAEKIETEDGPALVQLFKTRLEGLH
ncbi:hypothetical protein N7493_003633 [Penicillium malachiteum]|uniref:Protein ZIP4 homolog n=1 Tax=Penicillium malachiteum TaxID=1324776 RepID=A0AAD6HQ11_9EURO|nr:hypothetical protein N7493_003633 [Penicillium malachiteum]